MPAITSPTRAVDAEDEAAAQLARAIRRVLTCEPGCPDCSAALRDAIDAFEYVTGESRTPALRQRPTG